MAEQYSWDKALQEHYYVGSYSGIAGNIPNITRTSIADGKVLNNLVFLPYSGKDNYLLDSLNSTYSECSSFSGHLHDEIVMINARADVVDVVGTHEAFMTRSASMVPGVDITHRDVIKILNDVGEDIPVWVLQGDTYVSSSVSPAHQQTYYRWLSAVNNTTSGWEYVGDLEPYYSNIVANDNNQLLTFTNTNSDRNYNISAGSGVGFVVNERTVTISAQDGKISWVKYNQGSQTPEVKRSGLSVVTSEQGTRIQSDDATEKFYVAPNFSTPADTGKVFTIDNDGAAKWKKITIPKENPEVGSFIRIQQQCLQDYTSNTDYIDAGYGSASIPLKAVNGKYPSKVIGHMELVCDSTDSSSPALSVCMTETAHTVTGSQPWDPVAPYNTVNFTHLLGGGDYNNTLVFMFDADDTMKFKNTGIKYLTLKGRNDIRYTIKNLQLECFYEKLPEAQTSSNSVTDTENNSEND